MKIEDFVRQVFGNVKGIRYTVLNEVTCPHEDGMKLIRLNKYAAADGSQTRMGYCYCCEMAYVLKED